MIRRGIGVQSFVSAGGGTDADAQAFITAAGITDATQQSAINTLVTDLKGYGIWTKMKAIWPFVGGTSSSHKWNLRDPRDLDAAFRLVFSGGWTHSSTGALPNGTNAFADTFLIPNTVLNSTNVNISYYSRTLTTTAGGEDIGCWNSTYSNGLSMGIYRASSTTSKTYAYLINPGTAQGYLNGGNQTSTGLFTANRTANNSAKMFRNGVSVGTNTNTLTLTRPSFKLYLGASNDFGTAGAYSNKQCAFASIGDGLTDTEAANLYTAVQAYQTTLGRSVGTQTVSDSDAQAFVNAAVIEDQVQATAINTLVTDLKGYGIWSKMKAIYPFVGGTASAHKFNLKDPRDLDAAFRLVFSGGWTHSSTGALPNGTNGYSDTFFNPSVSFSNNNLHLSYYVRTYTANVNGKVLIGAGQSSNTTGTIMNWSTPSNPPFYYPTLQEWSFPAISTFPTKITGLHIGRRIDASNQTLFINNVKYNSTQSSNNKLPNNKISLGSNKDVNYQQYVDCECAFASIGDGLTDTEAANLYTAVQAYQTSLSRNV